MTMLQGASTDTTIARKSLLYEGQKRTLGELVAGMDDDARFILLTGPEGSGKSVILRALLAELRVSDADVVVCDGFEVVEPEALTAVLRGRLHLPPPTPKFLGRGGATDDIVESRRSRNSPLAVLVDNADGLSPKSLKLLVELVSRTTTDEGGAWVVLAGPDSFADAALRAAGKVKHLRCTPAPLTASEVAQHVDRKLRTEGDDAIKVARDALREITRCTKGLPGQIDALCELMITTPTVRLTGEVSVDTVQDAAGRLALDQASDVFRRKRPEPPPHGADDASTHARLRRWLIVSLVALVVTAVTLIAYLYGGTAANYGGAAIGTTRAWLSDRLFPPEPPRPEPAPTAKARPRASRREPSASATGPARTPTATRPGPERRSGAEAAPPAVRVEPARPTPPPITPEQMTALISSARFGRADEVTRLLALGVSPDVRDAAGVTALMQAVVNGHVATARVLLDKGAQVNAHDRGGITPIMLAVIHEQPEALELLLDHKADVNARSGAGWSALTFAAWKGDPDLVRTLLAYGAQRNVVDKQGWSPLDYATAPGNAPTGEIDASGASAPPGRGRHAEVITLLQGRPTP